MNKVYNRIVWENFPSEKTALNERNLNKMDLALDNLDDRVVQMDSTKVSVETANNLVKTWSIDEKTGIITVEKLNGERIIYDLNIEKIPVDFKLSEDGILTMTTDDGSKYTANIGAMIPVLTFNDSDTIAVSVTGTGVNKTYSFSIKAGSVTEDKLQPNFLADVKTEVAKAQASQTSAAQSASAASNSATLAESYTHGGTGTREDEETDNAKYYMEQAKAVSAVDIATTEKAGIVKPDGTTITVDPDGTIHGSSSVEEMTGATAEEDGTGGSVPAPIAGQQDYILDGSGKWKNPINNPYIDAKIKELNKAIEDVKALRASLEAYGMVKVTDSSAVTDSTGLALAATEKNSAIPGTLAHQFSQLNTDLFKFDTIYNTSAGSGTVFNESDEVFISHDYSKYKYVQIYVRLFNISSVIVIDMEHYLTSRDDYKDYYGSCAAYSYVDDGLFYAHAKINSEKTKLFPLYAGYYGNLSGRVSPGQGIIDNQRNNNNGYVVTKVEGYYI